MTKLSFLDLVPVTDTGTIAEALANAADLARHAEALGYARYWVAEHHGMTGIASAATSVVLAHLGHATERIRIGSAGIMLPNHAPMVIAEQFGTLEALFPGRIDLGLGRAPGSDQRVARALRRTLAAMEESRDVDASVAADAAFHAAIASATGNPYFLRFTQFLGVRLVPSRRLYLQGDDPVQHQRYAHTINRDHEAIVVAIEASDPVAARRHIEKSILRYRTLKESR